MKLIHKASCLLGLLILCAAPWALDAKQLLRVIADRADLNQQQHLGTYLGHVQFTQGNTGISAAKATTQGDEKNQLVVAILHGDTLQQAHYWSQPKPDKPPLHAYADIIRYYPKRHLIELQGNAKVTQGQNAMTAAYISYDTEAQHLVTHSDARNRTILILQPEKKNYDYITSNKPKKIF